MSMPSSLHGSWPGSRSESSLISLSPTRMTPSPASTGRSRLPSTESCFSRCAIVLRSPRSFAATISKSLPRSRCARKKFRPILPNPLIPTLVFAIAPEPFVCVCAAASLTTGAVPTPARRPDNAPCRNAHDPKATALTRWPQRRAGGEAPRTTLPSGLPHPRPWRRTGSEFAAGRARTRRCRV
jgi:hypothetical protein